MIVEHNDFVQHLLMTAARHRANFDSYAEAGITPREALDIEIHLLKSCEGYALKKDTPLMKEMVSRLESSEFEYVMASLLGYNG